MRPEGCVDGVAGDGVAFGDMLVAAMSESQGEDGGEGEEGGSRAEGRHVDWSLRPHGEDVVGGEVAERRRRMAVPAADHVEMQSGQGSFTLASGFRCLPGFRASDRRCRSFVVWLELGRHVHMSVKK